VLIGRTVGAEQAAAYVHSNLAYLARLAGDLDEALALLHHSISLFTAASDRDGEALALNHLGCVHRVRGEYREGRNAFERSLRLRRATGDRRAVGLTLGNLGVLTASEGGIDAGAALLEQALAGFDETQDAAGRVGTVLTMTSAGVEIDGAAAQRLAEALDESSRIPGNHRVTAWGYAMLSDAHRRLGHLEEAGRALQRAGDLFDALDAVDGATYVRVHAGALQTRR
jgi:tetratricopeptide (TPR) repeat protein